MKSCLLYIVYWSFSQVGTSWVSKFTRFRRMEDVEQRKFEPYFERKSPNSSCPQPQGGVCWAEQGGVCLTPCSWNENRLLQILIPPSSCHFGCSALLEGQRGSSSQESLVLQQEKQWECHWAGVSVQAGVTALSAELSPSEKNRLK